MPGKHLACSVARRRSVHRGGTILLVVRVPPACERVIGPRVTRTPTWFSQTLGLILSSSSTSGVDRSGAGAAAGVCAFPNSVRFLFEGGGWSSSVRSGESASAVERRRRLPVVEGPGVDATASGRAARELVAVAVVVVVVIVVVAAFTLVAGVSVSVAVAVAAAVVGAAAAAAVSLPLPFPVAALRVLEGAGAVLRVARVRVLRVSTVTASWVTSAEAGAGVRRVARRVDIALVNGQQAQYM